MPSIIFHEVNNMQHQHNEKNSRGIMSVNRHGRTTTDFPYYTHFAAIRNNKKHKIQEHFAEN